MKKLLICMTSLYNGGAERSLVNFLNELPDDKYQIDLLLFKREGMFLKQIPSFVNVLETPKSLKQLYGGIKDAGIKLPVKLLGTAMASLLTHNTREKRGFRWKYFYSKSINKFPEHYDVAIAYISGEILYYVDEKIDADKKIVWIHNDYRSAQHPKKYDYSHLKNMDYIASISDSCVNILKEEFPEFSDKIGCIPNITSSVVLKKRAEEFYPTEYQKDGVNILSIGRLHEQKGFDIAIEAAKKMKEKGIEFKWFVIGSGELEENLEKQILDYGLKDQFILLGARENPYPYISHCSLFVQPSRYEGKSVVLDEAKILAAPIIATAYPTVKDQLEDGKEGLIVGLDAQSICDGIESVLNGLYDIKKCQNYLANKEYGNQSDITFYYDVIG